MCALGQVKEGPVQFLVQRCAGDRRNVVILDIYFYLSISSITAVAQKLKMGLRSTGVLAFTTFGVNEGHATQKHQEKRSSAAEEEPQPALSLNFSTAILTFVCLN